MSQDPSQQGEPSSPPSPANAPAPGGRHGVRRVWKQGLRQLFSWPMLVALVLLLALEGGLRLARVPRPSREELLQGDPFQLWSMAPGTRDDLGIKVHVNQLGMRGAEISLPKPADVTRMLTLGDSSIYGFGVPDDAVFSQVMQRSLGPNIEVLNGAVGGYSTVQSLRFLQRMIAELEPEVLVIGSLWSDNTFDSFVDNDLLRQARISPERPTTTLYKVFSKSALFRLLEWTVQKEKPIEYRRIGFAPGHGTRLGLRRVEINDYAQNLDAMVRLGLDHGAHSLFIVLTNQDELAMGGGIHVWEPYRTVMRDTAARYGAPVLELTPLFQASGQPIPALFWDSMHPTVLGHRLLGEALVALLKQRGWPEQKLMTHPEGASDPLPRYTDPHVGQRDVVRLPSRPGMLGPQGSAADTQPGTGGPPNAGPPLQQTWIKGIVEGALPEAVRIQVDLLAPGAGVVMAGALDKARGFTIPAPVGVYGGLQVICDLRGDGPDPSDTSRRVEQSFEVVPGEKRLLKVQLESGTLAWVTP